MSGKKRAWLRKAIDRLRLLCNKDRTATDTNEAAPLVSVVSLSGLPSKPESARIRSDNKSPVTSPRTIPKPLVRPYSGAYPSTGAGPLASTAPRIRRVERPRKQLPKIQPIVTPCCLDNVPEVQKLAPEKTIRKQASAMSTNTIGWDTPIGDYAGGKQGFLHPTGLLELRRPESANRMAEIQEAADHEFTGQY